MKIKIINNNNNKEINLNNILLIGNNPRYTVNNKWEKEEDFLNFFFTNNDNQEEIMQRLLVTEGDFGGLVDLLESIYEKGYKNFENDKIILFQKENKIIVAEGNRRIMILKMILDPSKQKVLNNISLYEDVYSNEQNQYYDEDNEMEKNTDNKKSINIKKVNDLINGIRKKFIDFEVQVTLYNSEDKKASKIWNMIYEKHIVGFRKGLRPWSRTKYFADLLLNFQKKGMVDVENNNFFKILNRDKKIIQKDFKEAQLVYWILFSDKIENENFFLENENISWIKLDSETIRDMIEAKKPSALEKTHSWNKLTNIMYQKILMIDREEFIKKYISIEYTENEKFLYFKYSKINPIKLLKIIKSNWIKGIITTRNINKDNYDNLYYQLNVLLMDIDDNVIFNQSEELELLELNEFDFSKTQLENIVSANKFNKSKDLKRFKLALDIKYKEVEMHLAIREMYKNYNSLDPKDEPILIFNHLYKQSIFIKETPYLNLKSITIRSFLEQLYYWMVFGAMTNENLKRDYAKYYIQNFNIKMRNVWKDFLVKNGIFENKESNQEGLFKFINDSDLNKLLEINFKNTKESEDKKTITNYIRDINYLERNLLSGIHSVHQILFYDEYIKVNEEYLKSLEIVILILKNIDMKNLIKMNDLIKEILKNNLSK